MLEELCKFDFLKLDGKRYYTNIVIFTREFEIELNNKTSEFRNNIAQTLKNVIITRNMTNSQAWLAICCILYRAIFENLQEKIEISIPENKFGENCIVWAVEKDCESARNKGFEFGVSNSENDSSDRVQFFDFAVNGEMVHHSFYSMKNMVNVFVDIAKGKSDFSSEHDKVIIAELVKKGYVLNNNGSFEVNVPVFTRADFNEFINSFTDEIDIVEENAINIMNTASKIIKNYIPVYLKNQSKNMAYFRIFEDAISMPVAQLSENKIIFPYRGAGVLPTTYVLLNE